MASGSIAASQTVGGKGGSSDKILFLGSKITTDDDCSHEIRRRLLLGRKAMKNIDSVLKSRDITLLTKVHILKAIRVFPVVTCGCKSGTIKKVDHQRTDVLNCGAREDS